MLPPDHEPPTIEDEAFLTPITESVGLHVVVALGNLQTSL